MENKTEIWKIIKDYEGIYEISSLCTVKSVDRIVIDKNGVSKSIKGTIRKPHKGTNGYLYIGLKKNGIQKITSIHRLMAIAFIPNPKQLSDVNHKDFNKLNNSIENLEWCTRRENTVHYKLTQKYSSPYIGVTWHKGHSKWQSSIRVGEKRIYLGNFINEIDASLAYINYKQKHNII